MDHSIADEPALIAIAGDPDRSLDRRIRAIATLGTTAGPAGSTYLLSALRDPKLHPALRAASALAVGRSGGRSAVSALASALADPEPTVRIAAAQSLGRIGGDTARAELEDRLGREEEPSIREAIQHSLTKLQP